MTEATDAQRKRSQRGSVQDATEPRFLVIGEVVKPHGVRGEMRIRPHTELPERFAWLEQIYMDAERPRAIKVESVRFHKQWVLLKLADYNDRNAVESLRGELLLVPEAEALPLKEDEYYLYELEGLAVFSDTGEALGELREVLETKANNVFIVQGDRGEILLPDIPEVVQHIDFENGRLIVHLLPGLLP